MGAPMLRSPSYDVAAPAPHQTRRPVSARLIVTLWACSLLVLLLMRVDFALLHPPPAPAAPPAAPPAAAADVSTAAVLPPPAAQPLTLIPREPVVSLEQLRRSLVHAGGNNARARRVVHAILSASSASASPSLAGAPNATSTAAAANQTGIKIAVIGGSITAGARASQPGKNDWFAQVVAYASRAFPHARISGRNGALSATPSMLMDFCIEKFVDPDVSLVFVEYCANDPAPAGVKDFDAMIQRGYERLLRHALNLPGKPAVVLVQSLTKGQMYAPGAPGRRGFTHTREDEYGAFAQYYELPWLSARGLFWSAARVPAAAAAAAAAVPRSLLAQQQQPVPPPRTAYSPFFSELDDFHPNDLGHTAMADMVIYWLQQTVESLTREPFSEADARLAAAPLPPPVLAGNYEARNLACQFGVGLVRGAADLSMSRGFAVVDEGTPARPKVGLRAQEAFAKLLLRLNTTRGDGGGGGGDGGGNSSAKNTTVMVAYQESWRPMGHAKISCMRGCACAPLERVSAHVPAADPAARQTVAAAARLMVTPSASCEVEVEVLEEPGPEGSHAFNVVGVLMSEFEGEVFIFGEAQ